MLYRALTDAFDTLNWRLAPYSATSMLRSGAAPKPIFSGFSTGGCFRAWRAQQVIVADAAGTSSAPHPLHRRQRHAQRLFGARAALTIFARKAGVLRIELATVRMPCGCAPLDPFRPSCHCLCDGCSLADWEAASFRAAVLVICTVVVFDRPGACLFLAGVARREAKSTLRKDAGGSMRRLAGDAAVSGLGSRARANLLVGSMYEILA